MGLHPAIGVYGFPKSGNTWVQGVFAALGQEVDPAYKQVDIHISRRNKSTFNIHPLVRLDNQPCIVFKSHEKYDGEELFLRDRSALGISKLEKVILVKRNPFDMLLSFLNFSIWQIKKRMVDGSATPPRTHEFIRNVIGMTEEEVAQALDAADILGLLKQQGVCDRALAVFVESGFNIRPFDEIYGTWLEHITSWEKQKTYSVLSLRYEDLILNLPEQIAKLSNYIDVPEGKIADAFKRRQNATVKAQSENVRKKEASFYNKLSAGYFWEYFSADLLDDMIARHKISLADAGYGDLYEICAIP